MVGMNTETVKNPLTKAQLRKVKDAKTAADARADKLSEEIDRLEMELNNLRNLWLAAREVNCNAVNMMNGVLGFDERLLVVK